LGAEVSGIIDEKSVDRKDILPPQMALDKVKENHRLNMDETPKVREIIAAVRAQLDNLTSPLLFGFGIFRGPTQAAMFLFKKPAFTVLVFRSNPQLPDMEVKRLSDLSMRDALDKLPFAWASESQEQIAEFMGREDTISLAQLYERIFRKFFADLQSRVVEQRTGFEYRITGSHAVLISFGRPGAISVKAVVDDLIALSQRRYPSHQYFAHTGQEREGYFGRLPQGVWVGEMPVKTFREEVEDTWKDTDTVQMQGRI
jgi:hypothetical protein